MIPTVCLQSQKRSTGRKTNFVQYNCQSSRDFWNTVRVLFMDFSSAFNTIQTHALFKKLLNVEVNPHLIQWIRLFLCDRRQRDTLNGPMCRDSVLSDEIVVNTGAPQGFVLLQFCFEYIRTTYRLKINFLP